MQKEYEQSRMVAAQQRGQHSTCKDNTEATSDPRHVSYGQSFGNVSAQKGLTTDETDKQLQDA